MHRKPQLIHNRAQKINRFTALAVLLVFITVFLLSVAFTLVHAGHAHDFNGAKGTCAACALARSSDDLLKLLGAAFVKAAVVFAGLFAAVLVAKLACAYVTPLTPVALKTKMNN